MDQKKVDLARGLLMAAPHEINNVCAVLQSLAGAIEAGRPMPEQWNAEFWNGQATKLKKASENVSQAKNALMGWR